jgi:four helix bundle protein
MIQYEESFVSEEEFYVSDERASYKAYKDFTSLVAWQKAREVKLFFYNKILPKLPKEEKYNLDIQIRKASISTTSNIAEGYGRFHFQEGIQFYRISRGSLYELKDHLISCFDLEYITKDLLDGGTSLIESSKIALNGYIKYVQSQKQK